MSSSACSPSAAVTRTLVALAPSGEPSPPPDTTHSMDLHRWGFSSRQADTTTNGEAVPAVLPIDYEHLTDHECARRGPLRGRRGRQSRHRRHLVGGRWGRWRWRRMAPVEAEGGGNFGGISDAKGGQGGSSGSNGGGSFGAWGVDAGGVGGLGPPSGSGPRRCRLRPVPGARAATALLRAMAAAATPSWSS